MTELKTFETIPDGFWTVPVTGLKDLLGGPSLFYLKGAREPALFVSTLLHGNETTGFEAVRDVLRRHIEAGMPRSLWLFLGNVDAAAEGLRFLPGQADYNRVWPHTPMTGLPEIALMQEVVKRVTAEPLFASVDIHNNTGRNPHYGCINKLETPYLHLAALFSRTTVYFTEPRGVQSIAMADHCPAVTLECGQVGDASAHKHAVDYLEACLRLHHIPDHPIASGDIGLLHTVAVVKVKPGLSIGFDPDDTDISFRQDIDHFNFGRMPSGSVLASVKGEDMPVYVTDENGNDITDSLFDLRNGLLILREDIIPSMATPDARVIRQDCVFYVMEQLGVAHLPA
ncbi:M14 family metallopeptidase [Kordiimonas marina]|uniref:M14 family metallopeptidase n=1 Tax=Kordiimonas marina TaxID=2872312 RepID=UPI001FF41D78|nr:M14 family metallopeptidase [Kordiimonas marina]MCJ9429032.1 succinylglutamate desuccinylase/aspartoacylase family protein [Kordiimonas marina]